MRRKTTLTMAVAILTLFAHAHGQGFLDRLENVLESEVKAAAPVPGYLGLVAEEDLGALRVAIVREGTAAALAGIRPGDLIQQVGERKDWLKNNLVIYAGEMT